MSDLQIEDLARSFSLFAEVESQEMSPFYSALAAGVAEDRDLLEIVANRRPGQPGPNMLFGAVRMLLDRGKDDALLALYPTAYGNPPSRDAYPKFREFVLEHSSEIIEIISSRNVQSNVVRRSAVLLLGLMSVSRSLGGNPFVNVEMGASLGLTVLWDLFHYDYGNGLIVGNPASTVRIETRLNNSPSILQSPQLPRSVRNLGIELNPLDIDDPDDVAWLNGLIWPEHEDNRRLASSAIELARLHRPEIIAGDALEKLPEIFVDTDAGVPVSVYHSHTLNQFSQEEKDRLQALLCWASVDRSIFRLGFEGRRRSSVLTLSEYRGGRQVNETDLAECEAHGRAIDWIGD